MESYILAGDSVMRIERPTTLFVRTIDNFFVGIVDHRKRRIVFRYGCFCNIIKKIYNINYTRYVLML